jgi:hypothetical protein
MVSSPLWKDHAAQFLKPRGGYDEVAEQAYKQHSQDFVMDDVTILKTQYENSSLFGLRVFHAQPLQIYSNPDFF